MLPISYRVAGTEVEILYVDNIEDDEENKLRGQIRWDELKVYVQKSQPRLRLAETITHEITHNAEVLSCIKMSEVFVQRFARAWFAVLLENAEIKTTMPEKIKVCGYVYDVKFLQIIDNNKVLNGWAKYDTLEILISHTLPEARQRQYLFLCLAQIIVEQIAEDIKKEDVERLGLWLYSIYSDNRALWPDEIIKG